MSQLKQGTERSEDLRAEEEKAMRCKVRGVKQSAVRLGNKLQG